MRRIIRLSTLFRWFCTHKSICTSRQSLFSADPNKEALFIVLAVCLYYARQRAVKASLLIVHYNHSRCQLVRILYIPVCPNYLYRERLNSSLNYSTCYLTPINAIPSLACLTACLSACSSASVHFTLSWSHFLILYSLLNCACIDCKRLISRGSPEPE